MTVRKFTFMSLTALVLLVTLILGTSGASAADSVWKAKYYNNKSLSGAPVLERDEQELNWDWGFGSPSSQVRADDFSARWTRTVNFSSGNYRFRATMDDGMRVYVDDVLIIDSWENKPERTASADRYLSGGDHRIKVEYYEDEVVAIAKLRWEAVTPATINNWRGEYYNNRDLSGSPVFVRDDGNIDFNWGSGSPATNVVNSDNFSVRWTRNVNFTGGRYRFTTQTDDGVRLWVNGTLVIDQWRDQPATTHAADVTVPSGSIPIRMEYYDHGAGAIARLSWAAAQVTINNWRGEYFNNASLSGSPAAIRDDANVDFNWGEGGPMSGVNSDNFSVRWTRSLVFQPGRHRFTARVDDGVRLWVNDRLIIDRWSPQAVQSHSGEIELGGGPATVKMEYFDRTGFAEAHLSWERITTPPTGTGGMGTATVTGAYFLNVRSGPGLSHNVVTKVARGDVLNLLGYRDSAGTWVMVSLSNGTQGWVHAGYVRTSVPVSSLTVWTGQSGNGGTGTGQGNGTVNTAYLNVRSGPGISYNVLTVIARGASVTLTHRNAAGTWVRVTLPSGTQGWVNASYLQTSVNISALPIA